MYATCVMYANVSRVSITYTKLGSSARALILLGSTWISSWISPQSFLITNYGKEMKKEVCISVLILRSFWYAEDATGPKVPAMARWEMLAIVLAFGLA